MSQLAHRLEAALADLLRALPEIEAAALVTVDGLPMASVLPDGMNEDRVAAMSAALLSLGERAADGLGRGGLAQVSIEGEDGIRPPARCRRGGSPRRCRRCRGEGRPGAVRASPYRCRVG